MRLFFILLLVSFCSFGQNDSISKPNEINLTTEDLLKTYESGNDDSRTIDDIETIPIFPNCTGNNNKELKQCLSDKFNQHIKDNFKTDLAYNLDLPAGIVRIYVAFKIDRTGNIVDVVAKAPHPNLVDEAKRVFALLPQLTPGKQDGKPVGVLYSVPIVYEILADPIVKQKQGKRDDDYDAPPVFPNCDDTTYYGLKTCLNFNINEHISRTFNFSLGYTLELPPGKHKVDVDFVITKDGTITNINTSGAHPMMNKEAVKTMKSLPKMKPALIDDQPADYVYTTSINYGLDIVDDADSKKVVTAKSVLRKESKKYKKGKDVSLAKIDKSPVFPGCEDLKKKASKSCFSENVTNHIASNFNMRLAKSLDLPKGLVEMFAAFKINTEGKVTDVAVDAPHIKLREELTRVILLLPRMQPGMDRKKPVNVLYSFPLSFNKK